MEPRRVRPAPAVQRRDRLAGALFERLPSVGPRLSALEDAAIGTAPVPAVHQPELYVCGVARCGSTALLQALAGLPGATAHRYADFAGLWAPYWWNWWRARTRLGQAVAVERAHGDGIRVTDESPEALEEVLWTHFHPWLHRGLRSEALEPADLAPGFTDLLRRHVAKLLWVRGATRYVCKANYHLVRLRAVRAVFPAARFVVPIRAPSAHVASLLRQDARFRAFAAADPRIVAHLRRVGHYEFGPHKRAVHLGDPRAFAEVESAFAGGDAARGYALSWAQQHAWLCDALDADPALRECVLLVRHEDLRADPRPALRRIAGHAALAPDAADAWIARVAPGLASSAPPADDRAPADDGRVDAITADTLARLSRHIEPSGSGARV